MDHRSAPILTTADLTARGRRAEPFEMLFHEMRQMIEDARRCSSPHLGVDPAQVGVIMPPVDVSETDRELRVTAEIPGVTEGDIDVSIDEDVLTIRAEKRIGRSDDPLLHRAFGIFQRRFRLPFAADPDQVLAWLDDGVLTVAVPKNRTQTYARRIRLEVGDERCVQRSDRGQTPPRGAPGVEAGGRDSSRAH